jgi:cell wall assembly regulator SMI1
MNDIELRRPGPTLDASALDALEHRLGVTIPVEYRDFLLAHNGGVPTHSVFDVSGEGEDSINQFFVVGSGSHTDLERAVRIYAGRLPPGAIPIAEDGLGNLVLLQASGARRGLVLFWDHEREADNPTEVLASSLSEFLRSLRPDE